MQGGSGTDGAGLPDALGPEGVVGCGRLHRDELEARQLGHRDDAVVGEVRGDRVAILVVADLLEERLANTLGDATVTLALNEQRIDERAGIVAGDHAHEACLAGVGVDLDDRHVRAEREGRCAGEILRGGKTTGVGSVVGDLGPRTRHHRGARHMEDPPGQVEHDIVGVCLEQVGGEFSGLGHDGLRRLLHRRATELQRARPEGADALRDLIGVAMDDGDLVERDAQLVGGDHRP